jgi:hypothetical protein
MKMSIDALEYTVQKFADEFGGFRCNEEKKEVISYIRKRKIDPNNLTDFLVIALCAEYRKKKYNQLISIPKVAEAVRYLKSQGFTYEDYQRAEKIYYTVQGVEEK